MLGRVLSSIGAVLLVIAGFIFLSGNVPLRWLHGLTYVVLGIGLLLFMRQVMAFESGREARDRTEAQRRDRDDARWKERDQT